MPAGTASEGPLPLVIPPKWRDASCRVRTTQFSRIERPAFSGFAASGPSRLGSGTLGFRLRPVNIFFRRSRSRCREEERRPLRSFASTSAVGGAGRYAPAPTLSTLRSCLFSPLFLHRLRGQSRGRRPAHRARRRGSGAGPGSLPSAGRREPRGGACAPFRLEVRPRQGARRACPASRRPPLLELQRCSVDRPSRSSPRSLVTAMMS